jgi:hypothetical protein
VNRKKRPQRLLLTRPTSHAREHQTHGAPQLRLPDSGTPATLPVHSTAHQLCSSTVMSTADLQRANSATPSRHPCALTTQSRTVSARLNATSESQWRVASFESITSTITAAQRAAAPRLSHRIDLLVSGVPIPITAMENIVSASLFPIFFFFSFSHQLRAHYCFLSAHSYADQQGGFQRLSTRLPTKTAFGDEGNHMVRKGGLAGSGGGEGQTTCTISYDKRPGNGHSNIKGMKRDGVFQKWLWLILISSFFCLWLILFSLVLDLFFFFKLSELGFHFF